MPPILAISLVGRSKRYGTGGRNAYRTVGAHPDPVDIKRNVQTRGAASVRLHRYNSLLRPSGVCGVPLAPGSIEKVDAQEGFLHIG